MLPGAAACRALRNYAEADPPRQAGLAVPLIQDLMTAFEEA
jgi:hypothetical protein